MKFASLGSGSEGNALVIAAVSGDTRTTVMLDCGFGVRETARRLARLGLAPTDISGILVTHEHQDHVGGVFPFARRHRIPVWLSFGTYQAVQHKSHGVAMQFCRDGDDLVIGALRFHPYTVPHDAREPVQYVASNGYQRLGVLTDAGHASTRMLEALGACDALLLECNHDRALLSDSSYPYSLKQRVGGAYGHLSNDVATEILLALDQSRLQVVIGAHLSRQNNTRELAMAAICKGLRRQQIQVQIADQDEGFSWVDLSVDDEVLGEVCVAGTF